MFLIGSGIQTFFEKKNYNIKTKKIKTTILKNVIYNKMVKMKKFKGNGILGGMIPGSAIKFYDMLINKYFEREKNLNYPEIIIFSVNFEKILKVQKSNNIKSYIKELSNGLKSLYKAGADFVVIPSNTSHIVFKDLKKNSKIPILSIVEKTAIKAPNDGLKNLLLLGTKLIMQSSSYG